MVIVGPEDPWLMGVPDFFLNDDTLKNIPGLIGPQKRPRPPWKEARQFLPERNL